MTFEKQERNALIAKRCAQRIKEARRNGWSVKQIASLSKLQPRTVELIEAAGDHDHPTGPVCVEALASAFGMSTADFLGESVPVPAVFKVTIETHLIGDPKRAEDLYVALRDRLFAPDVAGEVLREAGVKAHLPGFGSITVKCDRRSARL